MDGAGAQLLHPLTHDWGCPQSVALYLATCQVDTPDPLVASTWAHVGALRDSFGLVLDFGAGDGRFARGGMYERYIGFEIDERRTARAELPPGAELRNQCAFSAEVELADLCIGNPPFVRNQHLPDGWRRRAADVVKERTGVGVSGLANAWQYFFLLALASVREDGVCALVIPYEWVSRPSAKALRDYIRENGWNVDVYRLVDSTFSSVLTTASVTIIDKASRTGTWRYFEENSSGDFRTLASPTGASDGVLAYRSRREAKLGDPRAIRGLSPGTQAIMTLTEGERVRAGLKVGEDVVQCVTSLRHLPSGVTVLDEATFTAHFREAGQKCWLIRTDDAPSSRLAAYLAAAPLAPRQTKTCQEREVWWNFIMPPVPDVLVAMSFKGAFPKHAANAIKARAVGGVYGVYNLDDSQREQLLRAAREIDLADRVVAHSNGLRKIEVNQLNTLLHDLFAERR